MKNTSEQDQVTGLLSRRELIRGTMVGGVVVGIGATIAACGGSGTPSSSVASRATGQLKRGGDLRIGATGGGAKDTLDAHVPVSDPDDMRVANLYEPVATRPPSYGPLEMLIAESLEPEHGKADSWILKIRPGVEFHNGKTVAAEDIIFTLNRIIDPKNPKNSGPILSYVDLKRLKAIDRTTVRIPLQVPNAAFPDDLGSYTNGVVPVGYDPHHPVGTGPFMYSSFTPGQQSVFKKFPNYWQTGKPYADSLTIIDFTDDTARVNALLGGQVNAIDNLPTGQIQQVQGTPGLKVLSAQTGSWQPFTMRVDQPPFSDVRVRQAMRLIVNRPQLVEQVLSGHGRIANDLYAPYDPAYDSALPQRAQDIEQAKSLLKQAGHEGLSVTLTTAPVFQGVVAAAEVFAQQAQAAGVTVNLQKLDPGTFYGPNYLKWTFAQDYYFTRPFLAQSADSCLPNSLYNECHWNDPAFTRLIQEARAELDPQRRTELCHQAQATLYDSGGYIIPYFTNQIDAYSAKCAGIAPSRSGLPLGDYLFKNVYFTS